jgi:hypothetical protein
MFCVRNLCAQTTQLAMAAMAQSNKPVVVNNNNNNNNGGGAPTTVVVATQSDGPSLIRRRYAVGELLPLFSSLVSVLVSDACWVVQLSAFPSSRCC